MSLQRWAYNNRHVQEEIQGTDFLSAQSTLIACGPPKLRQTGLLTDINQPVFPTAGGTPGVAGTSVIRQDKSSVFAWPLGITENIGIGQNRQLTRLFEIGSRKGYFINGRTVSSLTLARTMYDGPNLLRALYAYYPRERMPNATARRTVANLLSLPPEAFRDLSRVPGYSDFFINLDSDLFDKPFGLFLLHLDSADEPYGAFYIEDAYIQSHQFGISSQANIVGEGATIQFDEIVPVSIGAQNFQAKLNDAQKLIA